MIEIFTYSFLTSIFFISSGTLFLKKIINADVSEQNNFFQVGLYGFILLSFLGIIINFFVELNKIITTIIFFIFFLYILYNDKKIIKKIFLYSFYSALICLLILSFENTYRPDAGLYHLPYTKILNQEKIIFGLSNIHFRYGHTSIMQYLSALNNNWIFGDKGIVIPLAIVYSFFFFYLLVEIKNEKNNYILVFNCIIFSFLCLKLNRYSDFGNDAPSHIFYFFLISSVLKSYKNFNKINMSKILSISLFIIFNKITLFLSVLIPIIICFFKKKNFFTPKIILFLGIFTLSFFLKNWVVSGCFAFPIEKTCIKKTFWYDLNSNRGSNAKITMLENEAWTKGWSDQKENKKNFEEFLSGLNWINIWLENHGKRTAEKLLPFIFFLVVIIFVIHKIPPENDSIKSIKDNNYNKKLFLTLLLINIFGSTMWFLKFPVFRYGYSYLILTISLFLLILLEKKMILIELKKLKKIINYLIIFLIIIFVAKNFLRIIKNYDQNYNQKPWPKIYSDDAFNNKKNNKIIYKNTDLAFYQSTNGLCYYNIAPCTHMLNSQFTENEINFKIKWGYKVFYFSKN